MSLDLGTMYALVTLDDSDYKKKLAGLEKQSNNTFENIAKAAAAYLSLRAIGAVVQKTVGTFSDLEEETQKFSVVFAGMGERTTKVLQQLQEEFGLSELAAKRMLAGTGDMLTGFGFDRSLALTLSEGAAKLGADIASFSNYAGGAAGATAALTKAMLGEAESAKLLGVVIKQDSEEFKNLVKQAMTTGVTIKELGKQGENIIVQSEQQARAVAALALAYQQSPNAIGDFKRSQDSIANQTRILQNTFEQTASVIGGDFSSAYRDALGLANGLLKAYNELSPQTRLLLRNTTALTAAMVALSSTKAGAAILTYKAGLVGLAGGFKAAAVAAKGFFASIGPIGWAILALGGAYTVLNALISANTREIEENIKAAEKSADDAQKTNAQLRNQVNTELTASQRLNELAGYERLSNAEKAEAEQLLKDLSIEYDSNGKSISEMISLQGEEKRSLKELIEARKEELKQKRLARIEDEISARKKAIDANDEKRTGYWGAMGRTFLRYIGVSDGIDEKDSAIDAENQKHYDSIFKLRQEYGKLKKDGVTANEDIARKSKATRDALLALTDKAWNIKFRSQDDSGKLGMLSAKINELLPGKYASAEEYIAADRSSMSEQELKNLQKIVELEAQRKDLLKQSADSFSREAAAQKQMLDDRRRRMQEKAVEQSIKAAEKKGDSAGVQEILSNELLKAKQAADTLKRQYYEAFQSAQADQIFTDEERQRVEKLRQQWQSVLSDQDKWQSRIDTGSEEKVGRAAKSVGDWSAKVLAAQLGAANDPEKETAKNTRKTNTLLQGVLNNLRGETTYA